MKRLVHATAMLGLLLYGTAAFPAADLFVQRSETAPDFLDAGGTSLFLMKTRNQGNVASAASGVRLRIDENNDGSWEHTLTLPLAALPPHALASTRWKAAWTPIEGFHRYEVCADPDGVSGDGNTTNNCVYGEFSVAPTTPPPGFDLIIYHMKVSRAAAGRPMTFRAGVKNVGSVNVPQVATTLTIDGGAPIPTDTFDELRAEVKRTLRFSHVWTASPGVHTYEVCTQSLLNPYDIDPANNCASGTFVVGNP